MIRLAICISITFYCIQQLFNGYANASLYENLLIISNIICASSLLIAAIYNLYLSQALKKDVTHIDEDIYFNQIERRSYNSSYFGGSAIVIAFITFVIGFILVRDSYPMIALLSLILFIVSLFPPSFNIFTFLFPNYKLPDSNIKDTVSTLDFYDDGQKHTLLKSLYKLYFTTILLFIFLAFALMFYSIFSGNSQIVSIIGIGIILLILVNGLSGSLKPAKLK